MEAGVVSTLIAGLLLGIKHSFEPDHVIAVSTIASKSKSLFRSLLAGVCWGLGHSFVLFVVGLLAIILKFQIPPEIESGFEIVVGMMLVYLGVNSLFAMSRRSGHLSLDNTNNKVYVKSVAIGGVHGLAGSAALTILVLSTVDDFAVAALYILVFGAGTIIGMSSFTTALVIPIILGKMRLNIGKVMEFTTAVISLCFGGYYLYCHI
ncbi:urease accessory protein [Geobacillus kaustophilus HTA426]|uniref:Urease accessory protein n=1 Tax=Geobacillus kaustophilus (strain HTA426) TaxID=235909 RepID=Q5KYI9_GEOKA|nr:MULTISPECIES: urease accessory protein [Geobacillus]BAD76247.1 urease accessory protein [Geobacillus kaustophilus HTA426]